MRIRCVCDLRYRRELIDLMQCLSNIDYLINILGVLDIII